MKEKTRLAKPGELLYHLEYSSRFGFSIITYVLAKETPARYYYHYDSGSNKDRPDMVSKSCASYSLIKDDLWKAATRTLRAAEKSLLFEINSLQQYITTAKELFGKNYEQTIE